MPRRESNCPLCGASLSAAELVHACTELLSLPLGVLASRCPHCQGYVEIQPAAGQLIVGYLSRDGARFDAALTLACEDLRVELETDPPRLILSLGGRRREYAE